MNTGETKTKYNIKTPLAPPLLSLVWEAQGAQGSSGSTTGSSTARLPPASAVSTADTSGQWQTFLLNYPLSLDHLDTTSSSNVPWAVLFRQLLSVIHSHQKFLSSICCSSLLFPFPNLACMSILCFIHVHCCPSSP